MGSEGCRKVTARLPPSAEAALGKLLAKDGLTLRDLLLRLVALDTATAPVRGGDGLLAWLEAVARAGPPVAGGGNGAAPVHPDARERGRLGLLARRRQEEERRLAEVQARRAAQEQTLAALQRQARELAQVLAEAAPLVEDWHRWRPLLHLAGLFALMMDPTTARAVPVEGPRAAVQAALLWCLARGDHDSAAPPEEVRRRHPGLPALDLESLLTWSLTALAPRGPRAPPAVKAPGMGYKAVTDLVTAQPYLRRGRTYPPTGRRLRPEARGGQDGRHDGGERDG